MRSNSASLRDLRELAAIALGGEVLDIDEEQARLFGNKRNVACEHGITPLLNRSRRKGVEQVGLPLCNEARHFLADAGAELEAMAARTADGNETLDAGHRADQRIVVGTHVIKPGIAWPHAKLGKLRKARQQEAQRIDALALIRVVTIGVADPSRSRAARSVWLRMPVPPPAHTPHRTTRSPSGRA